MKTIKQNKMKYGKRILSLFLAAALMAGGSGCSVQEAGDNSGNSPENSHNAGDSQSDNLNGNGTNSSGSGNQSGSQTVNGNSLESTPAETLSEEEREEILAESLLTSMTLEEKIYQMFFITPEQLTGVGQVVQTGNTSKSAIEKYPVGGIIYFSQNLQDADQTKTMIEKLQSYSKIPLFTGVDEEGGRVARVGKNSKIGTSSFDSMMKIGNSKDPKKAEEVGLTIGSELMALGFNVDFAPVADIYTNKENTVIGDRAFGTEADSTAEMVAACVSGFEQTGISCTLKHYPGHGNTSTDSHYEAAKTDKTLEELREEEFVPFQSGIDAGADFVMVGHILTPSITDDSTPATLSAEMLSILREELGFEGIIITDSMSMAAITDFYECGEACVKAIQAGIDIILMPKDFKAGVKAVKTAVKKKQITEARIDESLKRILLTKIKKGILTEEAVLDITGPIESLSASVGQENQITAEATAQTTAGATAQTTEEAAAQTTAGATAQTTEEMKGETSADGNTGTGENSQASSVTGNSLCKGSPDNLFSQDLKNQAEEILSAMALEEKVLQMFIISPEALVMGKADPVTKAGSTVETYLKKYPVGGIVFTTGNLKNTDQTKEMLSGFQKFNSQISEVPLFLSVTEEGGTVTRVAKNSNFKVTDVGSMSKITTEEKAKSAGKTLGSYLKELGFNLDYAPVADVMTNDKNTVVAKRSFGSEPEAVAKLSQALLDGLHEAGILGTMKHFPGHGSTAEDSHKGAAVSNQTMDDLYSEDLVPYINAIEEGLKVIMVGHISLPNVTKEDAPATLSEEIITGLLREDLGFHGIIMTDSMNMGAIKNNYSSKKAAVKAVLAGIDIILTPDNFKQSYEGILEAIKDGTITEERIDESVKRILLVKLSLSE